MAFNPYYGNPYYQPMQYQPMQQMQQMPQQTTQTNVVEVSSESEASAYLVAAGGSVLLWNKPDKKFYFKSRDMSGSPYPMQIMSYTEDGGQPKPQENDYTSQLNQLTTKISQLEEKVQRLEAREVKPDDAQ